MDLPSCMSQKSICSGCSQKNGIFVYVLNTNRYSTPPPLRTYAKFTENRTQFNATHPKSKQHECESPPKGA